MAHVNEIIVLDDEEDDEPPQPPKVVKSPRKPVPQSNGKKEDDGKSTNKALILSAQNKQLFEEFVEYCSKVTSDHPEVITFLQGRYDKANPTYLTSVEFRNTLGRCLTRVQNKRTKVFVYINELCTALKANSQKRKVGLLAPAPKQPAAAATESVNNDDDHETEDAPERKKGSRRQIRYLENLLRIYSQEIQKLQERELTLEELEDEDSSYIQESRLKRKLVRIFEKLCEIKACPSLTGRVIEQRIQYRGTRYPEVNRRLEKFINSTRDLFPDYLDVLRVVQKTNDKYSLGLSRRQMQEMSKDAFCELGKKLKERRHLDMVYNFGSHLTDSFKPIQDPALQDSSLARHLRENRNVAMSHLDDIIKKYAEMQEDGEEEERKKWRKESEMPSTSKMSQSKHPPAQEQASDEEEEDEESEDSDTDIEEELKQSEQVEDGEEEEDENPGDQENEADQNMSDPQAFSSGGEEHEEDDVNNGEDENIEEHGESVEAESSPASMSLSHDKESTNTSMESGVEPLMQSFDTPTPDKGDDEHSRDQEDTMSHLITSETSFKDHPEAQQESNCSPQATEQAEDEPLCQEAVGEKTNEQKESLMEKETEKEEKEDVVSEEEEDVVPEEEEEEEEDTAIAADDVSVEESDDERTGADIEEESPSNNSEEPCIDHRTEVDIADQSSKESTAAEEEEQPLCTDPCVTDTDAVADSTCPENQSPDRKDADECHEISTEASDVDSRSSDADCDVSLLGNGVLESTDRENTGLHRLKRHKKKRPRSDSSGNKDVSDESVPCRKRKQMSSSTWTENGVTKYNGSEQVAPEAKRKCPRGKTSCSSQTSPASSSGPDSDHDLTLDLMVTCSPPETPPRPSDRSNKSHASTQCDPDEVIVLSD